MFFVQLLLSAGIFFSSDSLAQANCTIESLNDIIYIYKTYTQDIPRLAWSKPLMEPDSSSAQLANVRCVGINQIRRETF